MNRRVIKFSFFLFLASFVSEVSSQIVITFTATPNPCNGQSVATITAIPSGGTPPYTYAWNNGKTTQTITGLMAGTYGVTVDDSNPLIDPVFDSYAFNDPAALQFIGVTVTDASCFGNSDGKVNVSVGGGTPPRVYSWSNGATTEDINAVPAAVYTFTLSDINGCLVPPASGGPVFTFTVSQPPVLNANGSKTNVSCNGSSDGTARVNPSGGTPPYTYQWSANAGGATTSVVSGLASGTYTCTVTDTKLCVASYIANVTQPAVLVVTLNNASILCNGDMTAVLTPTVTGGTPSYSYSWASGQTTAIISGLGSGTYDLTVIDANSCLATASKTIASPPVINLTTSNTNNPCFGICIATATATATGGVGSFSYLWTNNATTSTLSNLCNGGYTVTATDNNGCFASSSITVSGATSISVGITGTNVSCNGAADGTATATISGGTAPYSYLWSNGATTQNLSGVSANNYSLDVLDVNGCSSTGNTIAITQPSVLSSSITGIITSCSISNGTATITPSGGTSPYTYLWKPGNETTPIITNKASGNYSVTVTDANNCVTTNTITLAPVVTLTVSISTSPLLCFGDNNATAVASVSGGTKPYNYAWSPIALGTSSVATSLSSGTYTMTVTDSDGCVLSEETSITDPPLLTAAPTSTDVSCYGVCDGTLQANAAGGTGALTYLWMPGSATTAVVNGQCSGAYSVLVEDANHCTVSMAANVNQPAQILANPSFTLPTCAAADGAIILAPSGGDGGPFTVLWTPGGSTSYTLTGVAAGIYTVTVTDNSTCDSTFQLALSNIVVPSISSFSTNVSCNGLSDGEAGVVLNASTDPPYNFLFIPGGQTATTNSAPTTFSVSSIPAGNYFIETTDASSCLVISSFSITEPPAIDPGEAITSVSCNGLNDGAISLMPSLGVSPYSFFWQPGGETTSSLGTLTGGDYSVTITDANSCSLLSVLTVPDPGVLTIPITPTHVSCNGFGDGQAVASPTGGTSPYFYDWLGLGNLTSTVTGLAPGTYTVNVRDFNSCAASQVVTITEPAVLTSTGTAINESCNGFGDGAAIMTGNGGTTPYSFSFSDGSTATGLTSFTVNPIPAGSYSGLITDANGCTTAKSYTITTPPVLSVSASGIDAKCFGLANGIVSASVTGGTPSYSYSWSPGGATTASMSATAGSYTVTVTDTRGCISIASVSISQPAAPVDANTGFTDPICFGSLDGTASSNPSGGTPPYTYLWVPIIQTTQNVTGLSSGPYTLTVTDANNCIDAQQVILTDPPPIMVSENVTLATCGVCDGAANITVTGGDGIYSYNWTPNVSSSTGATGLCADLYTVSVTDGNSCNTSYVFPVSNLGAPTVTVSTTSLTCSSICNGSATAVAVGGTPGYSYLWSDPAMQTTAAATGLCEGNYFVRVTDSANPSCIQFANAPILSPSPITAPANVVNATCKGLCDGAIDLFTSGGYPGYSYSWLPGGETAANLINVCGGITYTVTITDAVSCAATQTVSVSNNNSLTATVTVSNLTCAGSCSGIASTSILSGSGPFIYSWNDPASQASATATNLCTGTYSVNILDGIGCQTDVGVVVGESDTILITPAITLATCGVCDGQVDLIISGGSAPFDYVWSNSQTTSALTNVCVGIYDVEVIDANGCSASSSIIVNNNGGPTGTSNLVNDATCPETCNGNAVIVPIGGTAPFEFLWIPGGQTVNALFNMCAGDYHVQITDAIGCSYITPVSISSPSPINDNRSLVSVTCGTSICSGSITLNPSGGVGPYTYAWNTSDITPALTNLCTGIYTATITASNGCKEISIIPLNSTNGPDLTISYSDPTCGLACDGTATVDASGGGGAPYTYQWASGETTSSLSGLCEGLYIVQVLDATGCSSSSYADLIDPSALSLSNLAYADQSCFGLCDGTVTAIVSGGSFPYSYTWSSGGSGVVESNLCIGTYSLVVSDVNNCSAFQTVSIDSPSPLSSTNSVSDASCNTLPDGGIAYAVSGGTSPYQFMWLPGGETTQNLVNVLSNNYTVLATDDNGCIISDTITVDAVVTVIANAGVDISSCLGTSQIVLSGNTSTNASSFSWVELPSNNVISSVAIVSVTPSALGTNSYAVITTNGQCSDRDTVDVIINALPLADAGISLDIFADQSTVIGGSPTGLAGSSFGWSPLLGLDDSTIANPTATPKVTTTFTVFVTDGNGCVSADTIRVSVLPELVPPGGFTPNGDGANDVWEIDNIGRFPNCQVDIFNRWGELLFSSKGYKEKWDGTSNGRELPVATYYYIINLNDPLFPDAITGPISIIR